MNDFFNADRRLFLKCAAAAALVPLLAHCAGAEEQLGEKFYIRPYLQNPTADGMTICFAAIDTKAAKVRWGSDKSALNQTANMTSLPISKITWLVWKARLTGLQTKQTYYYQVVYDEAGAEKASEVYSFTPFDPRAGEVRTVIYNDVHDRIATVEALVQWVKPEDFTFSILLGDMWGDPDLQNNARRAFLNLEAYVRLFDGSNKPMMFVRGNHDVRGGFASRLSYLFDFPLNDPTAEFADQNAYYDFRVGPVWFICPDSGEDESKRMEIFQPYRERQAEWLAKILQTSPNRDAPWRALVTHIPLYYQRGWEASHSRKLWEPALRQGEIDVAISGHMHSCGITPKGKEIVRIENKGKPEETTIRYTPLFPTFIGGGPGMKEATVTFLKADAKKFALQARDTQGKEVLSLSLDR